MIAVRALLVDLARSDEGAQGLALDEVAIGAALPRDVAQRALWGLEDLGVAVQTASGRWCPSKRLAGAT